LYDWVALLWAAFGEFPARNLLANVNYRRALPFISDYRNLFGTRVILDPQGKVMTTIPGSTYSAVRLRTEIPGDFYDFQNVR
jgi:hypothetical protein